MRVAVQSDMVIRKEEEMEKVTEKKWNVHRHQSRRKLERGKVVAVIQVNEWLPSNIVPVPFITCLPPFIQGYKIHPHHHPLINMREKTIRNQTTILYEKKCVSKHDTFYIDSTFSQISRLPSTFLVLTFPTIPTIIILSMF